MKTVRDDILNTHIDIHPVFTIKTMCHECGSILNLCDNPRAYGNHSTDTVKVLFVEPCMNCISKKLEKIKELI